MDVTFLSIPTITYYFESYRLSYIHRCLNEAFSNTYKNGLHQTELQINVRASRQTRLHTKRFLNFSELLLSSNNWHQYCVVNNLVHNRQIKSRSVILISLFFHL